MCARFTLAEPGRVADRYPQFRNQRRWPPRYNIAPAQDVAAARADGVVTPLRWGLVPAWSDRAPGGTPLINARVETLAERPAFRDALASRRCVIFADGFYEWSGPKTDRRPHRFTVDGGAPFAFAGLWERWERGGEALESCAIVTCAPNALCARVHDRMPAILDDAAVDHWLHGNAVEALAAIAPLDAARMRVVPVSPAVNRATFDEPRCIEPFAAPEPLRLFGD